MKFVEFLEDHFGSKVSLADQYGDWLGYRIEDIDKSDNEVTTYLSVRNEHLSPSGAVHGGVISGFLDFSCGCAVINTLNQGELCSTVDLAVKYFKPLKTGDNIIAQAKVVNRGKTLCSVITNLYREDDMEQLVAMATGTFNIYQLKK